MHGPGSLGVTVDEIRTSRMNDMIGMHDYLIRIDIDYFLIYYDIIYPTGT